MSTFQKRTDQLLETVEDCVKLARQGDDDASGTTFGAMEFAVRALVNHMKYPERKQNSGLAAMEAWSMIASSSEDGPSCKEACQFLAENRQLAEDMSEAEFLRAASSAESQKRRIGAASVSVQIEEVKKEEEDRQPKKRKVDLDVIKTIQIVCEDTDLLQYIASVVVRFGGTGVMELHPKKCLRVTRLTDGLLKMLIDPEEEVWRTATHVHVDDAVSYDGMLRITAS